MPSVYFSFLARPLPTLPLAMLFGQINCDTLIGQTNCGTTCPLVKLAAMQHAHRSNQLRCVMLIGQTNCAMRHTHWSNQLRCERFIRQANRDATCSLVNSRTKHAMCCRVWVGAGTLGKTLGFHENCSETENGASSEGVGKRRTSFLARH